MATAVAFDYSNLSLSAANLIYRFGDAVSVRAFVDTPAANQIDPPTRTQINWDTRGVKLNIKSQDIDNSQVLVGDCMVLLTGDASKLPIEAKNNGTIVIGSESWKIINIATVKPGPLTLLYKVQVRK